MTKKKKNLRIDSRSFNIIGQTLIWFVAIVSLVPFLLLVSGSFSNEVDIALNGFSIIPEHFTTQAYRYLFRNPTKILSGYRVSLICTVVGTSLGLFFTSMTGYVLSRHKFRLAGPFALYLYFTTLFGGGLLPFYLLIVKYLHWKNTWYALIIPSIMGAGNMIIMKNFAKGIPYEISESAIVDGAGEFQIFTRLYLPMMKPALATIGTFMALGYWNSWSSSMLYASKEEFYSLQYILYRMSTGIQSLLLDDPTAMLNFDALPTQTVKMAMTIIATGPIVLVYPFAQRYFVQGITIGAVKG